MTDRQAVALGEAPADLVVRGGRVFRPETGTFDDVAVAVADGEVAALPADPDPVVGPDTDVVAATDRVVVPGFVDAHTHVDLHQTFETSYHYSLRAGTTTVVTEAAEYASVFGAEGVRALLDATADLPVTVRATVPPAPLYDAFERPSADVDDLVALLDDDRVVGVGEVEWVHVVGRDPPATDLIDAAHARGLTVGGHGAGVRDGKLDAFAQYVDDDHEAISAEGIVERVEDGVHAIGRYGSIRDDVAPLAAAAADLDTAELSLSSDGMWPRELLDEGHMDAVVERAIEAGVPAPDALRMATLAPARHFGLDDRGSLAPGNAADVVVLEDLETVDVATVVREGEVVVHNHDPRVAPRPHEYPDRFYGSVAAPDAGAFRVPADAARDGAVRALEYRGGLLSGEATVEPREAEGELRADPANDVSKAALFDRRPTADRGGFVGFVTGFGLDAGAVATSVTWETPGLLAVGTDDADLRAAADRVAELGGGWAVVADGETVVELPAPVAGFCSTLDVEETAQVTGAVSEALRRRLGTDVDRPMLGLQTLAFTGVPSLKLTFSGYAAIKDREVRGLTP